MIDRKALREMMEKATARPWRSSMSGYSIKSNDADIPIIAAVYGGAGATERQLKAWLDNSDLIVAAVNNLPALLDALDAAEAAHGRLIAERDTIAARVRELEQADIDTLTTRDTSKTEMVNALTERADKLQHFKDYVHQRLDKAGVPHDPDPEHNAQHGCRIEGRLNYVFTLLDRTHEERQMIVSQYLASVGDNEELRQRLETAEAALAQEQRDGASIVADERAKAQAFHERAQKAEAEAAAMRDWCAAWLIRARQAIYREGWEEGMSANEASSALCDVLHNLGCDEGTEDPEQVAEYERLVALDVTYSPPTAGAALLAEMAALRERLDAAGMRWPQTVAELEKALSSFPAGRIWLGSWTQAENDRDTAEAAHKRTVIELEKMQRERDAMGKRVEALIAATDEFLREVAGALIAKRWMQAIAGIDALADVAAPPDVDSVEHRVSDTPCWECGYFAVVESKCFLCEANAKVKP